MSGSSVWTVAHLAALREAAASGLQEVTFADGRKTRWADLGQLSAMIQVIEASLIAQGSILPPGGASPGVYYSHFERC